MAEDRLASKSGFEVEGWCAPWTVSAIRSATTGYLGDMGALVSTVGEADILLVDLVDQHAGLAAVSLAEMAAQARPVGRRLVVRLHAAWRDRASDFLEHEGPDLSGVWESVDAVLVASRSHLVRLANAGGLDAAKTRLAPVAFAGCSQAKEPSPAKGARAHLLVAGETHREAIEPVLEMLKEADPGKATFGVVSCAARLRDELGSACALLVPATEAFGDRSLVETALRAGVPVVASECASVIDAPLPPGVVVVNEYRSSAAWREALEAALRSDIVPHARALSAVLDRQLEILMAIHAQDGGTGSHFEREAAA